MAVVKTTWGTGDRTWLGSNHALENAQTGSVDVSAFTAGTHYPGGFLPSGTRVNAANLDAMVPFTDTAGAVLGFLVDDIPVSGLDDYVSAAFLWHGRIKTNRLPSPAFSVPATATVTQFYFVSEV